MRALSIFSFSLLVVSSACSPLPTESDDRRGNKLPIDTTLGIVPWEVLSPEGRSLEFRVRTERIYPCANYLIAHELSRHAGRMFGITFSHVIVPEGCLTALGPASANLEIGSLPPGEYAIGLVVNGTLQSARLSVTEEAYEILDGEGPWTRFEPSLRRRVPEGTIWGLSGYSDPEEVSLVEAFEDSLRAIGARDRTYAPGDYGYYEVDPSGRIETPSHHGYRFARAFLFDYVGDLEALRNLVKRFSKSHPDVPSIQVSDWRGGVLYSWILRWET